MTDNFSSEIPEKFGRKMSIGPLKSFKDLIKLFIYFMISSFFATIYNIFLFPLIFLIGVGLIFIKKDDMSIDEYFINYILYKLEKKSYSNKKDVTELFGDIKLIDDDVLKNGDGYFSLIEIKGTNLFLLPDDEMRDKINKFDFLLNSVDFDLHFKIVSAPITYDDNLSKGIDEWSTEYNEMIKNMFDLLFIPKYYLIISLFFGETLFLSDDKFDKDDKAIKDLRIKKDSVIKALERADLQCNLLQGIELYYALESIYKGYNYAQ